MSDASAVSASDYRRTAVMGLLTVLAGAVDAISFLTMGHVFCALATGNVLFLAFALAGEGDVPVARPATTIAGFVLGAAVSGVVLKRLADRGRPWFPVGLTGEALLLAGGGAVVLLRHGTGPVGDTSDFFGIGLVSLAMGVRASTALRMRVPGMPTLLSQTAIAELVNDVLNRPAGLLRGASPLQRLARTRWTATVVGIFLGGALSTLLLVPLGTGWALLVIAVLVVIVAVFAMLVPLEKRQQGT